MPELDREFALGNALAADIVDVFERDAPGRLDGGIVPQELLDGIGDERGAGPEQRELVGIMRRMLR